MRTQTIEFFLQEQAAGAKPGTWRTLETFEEGQWLEGAETEANFRLACHRAKRPANSFQVVRVTVTRELVHLAVPGKAVA